MEGVQLTTSEPEDKSVLASFINSFREKLDSCKQKAAILFPANQQNAKVAMIQRLGESAAAVGSLQVRQQWEKQILQQQLQTESQQLASTAPASSSALSNLVNSNAPLTQSMQLLSQQQIQQQQQHFNGPFPKVLRRNSSRI
jgi:hypothetical protein